MAFECDQVRPSPRVGPAQLIGKDESIPHEGDETKEGRRRAPEQNLTGGRQTMPECEAGTQGWRLVLLLPQTTA